jgi:MFS family permease
VGSTAVGCITCRCFYGSVGNRCRQGACFCEQQGVAAPQNGIVALLCIGCGAVKDATEQEWIISVLLLGAILGAFSASVPMLIIFRFILGVSVGTASFVSPLYISEVSTPRVRGGLVSFNQLAVTSGILLSYIVDFLFKDVPGDWRWMLGLAVIPGAALAIGMLTVPHTPRWLAQRAGRRREISADPAA